MCGLAGYLGGGMRLDVDTQQRVLQSLRHRGPDDQRATTWPEAAFLHTRLRIIDL